MNDVNTNGTARPARGGAGLDRALDAIFGNGPIDTQVTPGREKYLRSEHGAASGTTLEGVWAANIAHVATEGRLGRAFAAAACLAFSGQFAAVSNWATDDHDVAGADDVEPPSASDFEDAVDDAIAVIAATKVNWWKSNHHTGVGIASGFALRVLKYLDVAAPGEDETTIIWRIGHWFSTAAWIDALGATGVDKGTSATLRARVRADEAVAKRIASGPAGTANFEAVIVALRTIATHAVLGAVHAPSLLEWTSWLATHRGISTNAGAYHVGAVYLGHAQRLAVPDVPDSVISFCATCIRYINRSATLLNASVFRNVADDGTVLTAIRAASEFDTVKRQAIGAANWFADQA